MYYLYFVLNNLKCFISYKTKPNQTLFFHELLNLIRFFFYLIQEKVAILHSEFLM